MSWQQHIVSYYSASTGTGVKVSLRKIKATGTATTIISINDRVANELGWKAGDKLELLVGEEEHHGLLRLRPSPNGSIEIFRQGLGPGKEGKTSRSDRGYFSIRLGVLPQFVQRSESGRWIKHEVVEDNWVEFILPSWADETDPRKAKKLQEVATITTAARSTSPAIPPSVAQAANFKRPVRNVTGSIMGDPPPNRNRG